MVKIRLTRMGAKKAPFYRLVVAESRSPRDGKVLDNLGTLNPLTGETKVDVEKCLSWLNKGAQPTDTAKNILSASGVMEKYHNSKRSK